jgi:magnesium-transporting ATPase (P-type)
MAGIAFSNLIFIATIILFFIFYESKKIFKLFNKSFFVYIILLYIFIIFTSTVSEYKNSQSLLKSLSTIKFFLFPIAFLYLYKNDKDVLIKISRISLISIILISADLYFQYIFGFDIFSGYLLFRANTRDLKF